MESAYCNDPPADRVNEKQIRHVLRQREHLGALVLSKKGHPYHMCGIMYGAVLVIQKGGRSAIVRG
jgi:hypothetical protein